LKTEFVSAIFDRLKIALNTIGRAAQKRLSKPGWRDVQAGFDQPDEHEQAAFECAAIK
jgi:hypothetical protein